MGVELGASLQISIRSRVSTVSFPFSNWRPDFTMKAFPTGCTNSTLLLTYPFHSSGPASLHTALAVEHTPPPLTLPGLERSDPSNTHMGINLRSAEPKPPTGLISLGKRTGIHSLLLPETGHIKAVHANKIEKKKKKKKKHEYQVPKKPSKSFPEWTFNPTYA